MLGFKKFVIIWFSVVILGTVLISGTLRMLYDRPETNGAKQYATEGDNHFSVRWLGFIPDYYSDEYPDYYICINDLKEDVLTMHVAMKIENYENSSYYFSVEPSTSPPAGWTIATYQIGDIWIDEARTFVYSNINRSKPDVIPEGRKTESIELAIRAYRDPSYTDLYSQDNFIVNFHFIDKTSPEWTILSYENGEEAPFQGWAHYLGPSVASYKKYRSWPNSLEFFNGGAWKWFNTTGDFTEAYLILPIYLARYQLVPGILYNGSPFPNWPAQFWREVFRSDIEKNWEDSAWYSFTFPIPVNKVTQVYISQRFLSPPAEYIYIDEVYLIAK
jgi:hypothetical protein